MSWPPDQARRSGERDDALAGVDDAGRGDHRAARNRALLAYTSYLGHAQLAHSTPLLLPRGRALATHIHEVVESLVELG